MIKKRKSNKCLTERTSVILMMMIALHDVLNEPSEKKPRKTTNKQKIDQRTECELILAIMSNDNHQDDDHHDYICSFIRSWYHNGIIVIMAMAIIVFFETNDHRPNCARSECANFSVFFPGSSSVCWPVSG